MSAHELGSALGHIACFFPIKSVMNEKLDWLQLAKAEDESQLQPGCVRTNLAACLPHDHRFLTATRGERDHWDILPPSGI